ncbi:MAG: SRPBCC domain-containing protein [Xanthomonadales bacterium]|nr:SRPBCC domain-containing protein [Xanthomonadales bacterium]
MIAADVLEATIDIATTPSEAFRIFTEETDAWWQHGGKYRPMMQGKMMFEPGVGGRLLQRNRNRDYELGAVLSWEPGEVLEFEWRLDNFEEGQLTRVRITFTPIDTGTRLHVRHSGWDTLPPDHPARHGRVGQAFVEFRTCWWNDFLAGLARFTAR